MTTAMASLGAPSQLAAATVIVWPPCSSRASALRGARSLHLSECEICDMMLMLSVSASRCCCLLRSCMGAWEDVFMRRRSPPFEPGSLLCLSWHVCDFDNPPLIQPGAAVICCLVSVCAVQGATSPQRIVARWIRSADGTCFSSA